VFTGIVEDIGRLVAVAVTTGGTAGARRLTIETRLADEEMPLGASLAVEGTCLTVVAWEPGRVALVAAAETLSRTTLGSLAVGARVNLERPLRLGDRLGGHLVAGHVDGVGRIASRSPRGEALDVAVAAAPGILRYVVEKGSIAVDGISLTVNAVDDAAFSVSLIPHTLQATTLGQKGVGARVNLEVDLIGKYVERLVAPHRAGPPTEGGGGGGLTREKLEENGFV
jgi:riboflavin synthase